MKSGIKQTKKGKSRVGIFVAIIFSLSFILTFLAPVQAVFNPEINYQGKLTNAENVAVADGDYNMEFKLYTTSTGGTAVWTETLTLTNKVTVTNGLFSVLLGNVESLSGVDFNQNVYLGVNIGGSGSASWDGEMTPRKQIASVPSAFEAGLLDGLDSTQFVRSDTSDTIASSSVSTLLSIVQSGVGNILSLFDGATEVFTVKDGGNIGIGTTDPDYKLTINDGAIHFTSTEILDSYKTLNPSHSVALTLNSAVGNPNSDDRDTWVFKDPYTSSNWGIYFRNINSTDNGLPRESFGFIGNNTLNAYISTNDGSAYFRGNVGIGTTNPSQKLHVIGNILASADIESTTGTITTLDGTTSTYITGNLTTLDLGTNTLTDENLIGNWGFNSGNLSGIGTIASGVITATGHILSGTDSTYNLGASGNEWANLYVDTITTGAIGTTGNLDMNNNLILNIGNTGTDFTATGGLNLAGDLDINGTSNDIAGTLNLSGNALTSSGDLTITPPAGSDLDIVLSGVGDFAVNTNQFYVDTSSGNVGIGTTAPSYKLDVIGDIRTTGTLYATSTEITNLTMTNASTTQLTVSDKSWLGTVSGGVWNGTIIGDDYLTKTGDWTGTFDGQQGSYYLDADNLTDFGNPFYTYFNATTTTALSEGINLYYTDVRVADYINASTTMPVADWNTAYNWGDHAGLYDTLGQATSTKDWLLTQDNTWTGTGDTTFAGNVGIGDTTPGAKLGIVGGEGYSLNTKAAIALYGDIGGTIAYPHFIHTGHRGSAGSVNDNFISFYTSDGTVAGVYPDNAVLGMTIRNGNVGIGTTVPVQKLHVDGKIRVEGVNANQDLIISDGDMIMVQDDKNYLISGGDATHSGANLAMFGGEHAALANLFRIRQGGTTVLSIINGGNVGIGTTAPTAKLQSLSTTEQLRLNYDDANYASFTVASTSSLTIAPSVSTATTTIGSGDETFRIDSSGNVGIGITNPTHQLQLSGTAAKPGTAYWIVASDERLKDVNGDFTRGLEALSGLYPSYFNYKIGNAQNIPHDREYIGLIAQDVQAVIPEAVVEGADGFLAIETDPILWTMLNAIKELALEVGSDIISYQRDDSGQPQVKIAYDDENYVEMQVNATGDLDLSTIGGDVRLPDENMLVCSGGACSSEVSQLNGTGNLAVENTAFIGGSLGVGTVETDRAFSVLRGGDDPQMKIAYDDENYAEMQVSAVGDLVLSARGGDVKLQDENMQVCAGGACPSKAGLLEGAGNLVVENIAYVAGALGVGTAQPQRGLDVYETQTNPQMRISYDEDLYSELSVSATGDLTISAEGGDISALNENFKVCSGDGCPSEVNVLQGTGNLVVENNILALGSVGINTADPSYTLDVNGTLRAHGITDASDIRLKTNIQNLNKVGVRPLSKVGVGPLSQITLSKLDNLRGVTFNWINKDFGENLQVGMISGITVRIS